MGSALIGLRKAAYDDPDIPGEISSEINRLEDDNKEKNRRTSLVIGLSSVNRISRPKNPLQKKRMSSSTEEWEEAAAPGFVTAKTLAVLGHQVALVSKIGQDSEGDTVREALTSKYVEDDKDEVIVDLDYLDEFKDDLRKAEHERFKAGRSYVIIHSDVSGQRVMLDNHEDLKLDPEKVKDAQSAIEKYPIPVIFFDRFLSYDVRNVLEGHGGGLCPDSWTVYETGTNGDRWKNYRLEKKVLHNLVNIAIASFPFARDFLAKDQGLLDGAFWEELGGRDNKEEAIDADAEQGVIDNLLNDKCKLKQLANSISEGAKKWLRESDPRLVIVTLHKRGCIWINPETLAHKHVEGIAAAVPKKEWYTNMAGDVFRAVFTAAVLEVKCKYKNPKKMINDPNIIEKICVLSNEVASEKIRFPTFKETITCGRVKELFKEWKENLP